MRIQMVSVHVNDPIHAFKFYTEVLGFKERLYMPEMLLAIVVAPEDPNGTGLLLEPSDHPVAKAYKEGIYNAGFPSIVFGVTDMQQEYERLIALGVKFTQTPQPTPSGGFEAVLDDTCGNLVQLYQL